MAVDDKVQLKERIQQFIDQQNPSDGHGLDRLRGQRKGVRGH